MRTAILAFAAGAAWLQFQSRLPDSWTIQLLLAGGLLLCLCASRLHQSRANLLIALIVGAALGFGWSALLAQQHLAESLPPEWEGRDVSVIGTVDSLPDISAQGVHFNFLVEHAYAKDDPHPPLPRRISLSWYAAFRGEEAQSIGKIEPGARWRLTVRLKRPHGNANPWGFDYEVWLLEQNLRATGYVRQASGNALLTEFVPGFGNVVERCRAWLRARILAALPDRPYAGVIVALVVGDQRTVSQADWKVFNRSGIGHLISISGLHITMIAGLAAGLMSLLWRRSFFTRAALPLILPAQKAAAVAGVLTAFLYVLLAGFGVPAQRTLYMVGVVALALWCGRITSISHVLCAALGLVLLLDPWAVLWPGFWLSFGAVGMILFASVGRTRQRPDPELPRRLRWLAKLRAAAHLQYVVTVGLVPLSMLLFGQLSLISPLANAIAIPLVSFIVTPLALFGSFLPAPLAGWILGLAHGVISFLAGLLGWLSSYQWAVWNAPLPPFWIFACAMTGAAWLLAPSGWPQRWLGLPALLPLVLNVPIHPEAEQMWVTTFDVGQGMALLVETTQHRLLYDTGPTYSPESDGASRVVLPYLKARGINSLDAVIISHNDNDHSGGALSAFAELQIAWVSSSLAARSAIVLAAPRHRRCEAGQKWEWDGVQFEMLHPDAASYDDGELKPNARSCTLKITRGKQAILLAGDIEAAQEANLVALAVDLRADVLLAPHHGSATSSSPAFLAAVQPRIALFQVGYRNRYHHPKAEVFQRYGEAGIQRLRTDSTGAITLEFTGNIGVTEYRAAQPRYWYEVGP